MAIDLSWARLREAYEARLLEDVSDRVRPSRSYDVLARDPETGAARVLLRGPRPLKTGAWFLRPQFLQFGLPVSAVSGLAMLMKLITANPESVIWFPPILAVIAVSGGFGVWWNTVLGGWVLKKRWRRLQEEAYDTWTYRLAAARDAARRLEGRTEDEERRLEEVAATARLMLPGR